jgi:radical SAM superfamily enzyme YgiQ (UPF0313 family)
MRVLLVNPEFPESYWSGRHSLAFARRRSLIPPLGLITVAALLPDHWECRLVDLNIEPLEDSDLRWADVVMLTGMLVQKESLHQVLERCAEMGIRTAVGGPYATALPQELEAADHVVVGEGEELVPVFAQDLEAGEARPRYTEAGKPDMTTGPVPRYDLLKVEAYHHMALQYSRGCPFNCEFCDIIVMYGRKPRTKTSQQILAELDAIHATGFHGDVFFVDDNFIGNKKAVKEMLPAVAAWREGSDGHLEFYTEASINLADDEELVDRMTAAGFTAVFIGIESPSPEALKETRKNQNLRRDVVEQVHWLQRRGLDVYAGFILGFDEEGPDIFNRMVELIEHAAIPYAMVGILGALPNTPLYERLEKEGRLRPDFDGDQFGLTNVVTKTPAVEMLAGYRHVMESLYDPEAYFRRCRSNLEHWEPVARSQRPTTLRDLGNALRAVYGQGLSGRYIGAYWKHMAWVLRHHPSKLGRALQQAASGHHYITYTRSVVVPALEEAALEEAAAPMGVEQPAMAEGV